MPTTAMQSVSRYLAEIEQLIANQAETIRQLRADLKRARKDRDRYKRIVAAAGVRAHAEKWGGPRRKPKHNPA